MTYRDMVRVSQWRKYDDPERYIEESSKASATWYKLRLLIGVKLWVERKEEIQ